MEINMFPENQLDLNDLEDSQHKIKAESRKAMALIEKCSPIWKVN